MKRILEITLGIVTGIGGFFKAGSLAAATQAGADFRFDLIWSVVLGAACLTFLLEMPGRLAAISKHTVADAMRERFGFHCYLVTIIIGVSVMGLVTLAFAAGAVQLHPPLGDVARGALPPSSLT